MLILDWIEIMKSCKKIVKFAFVIIIIIIIIMINEFHRDTSLKQNFRPL